MSELVVQHLLGEHAETQRRMAELEGLLQELRPAQPWERETRERFARVAEFLEGELLLHKRKEEEVLFPALETFLPASVGALAALRAEHLELFADFGRLRECGEKLAGGQCDDEARARFQYHARNALRLLGEHMEKEEKVLFPLVWCYLTRDEDTRLRQQMAALEPSLTR